MTYLNKISDNQGARKERNRVGRGMATGNGKTAGSGHKGQKARSGGNIRAGFEGGQFPLYRRLPMRGFNNARFTKTYAIVNVGDLQRLVDEGRLKASEKISINSLQAAGVTKKAFDGLKVLGNGELKVKLTIDAAAASKSAVEKVTKAGGKLNLPEAAKTEESATKTKESGKSDK